MTEKTTGTIMQMLQSGDTYLPYYVWYEMNHAAVKPLRVMADATRLMFRNPFNPAAHTSVGRSVTAACELFERVTRRYEKPSFGLNTTVINGETVAVVEEIVWEKPFCKLIHFNRQTSTTRNDPKLLIVAPMSGHYATLLRGTVETMLPHHDVYITDWTDARTVPVDEGKFDLDDYIDYLIDILHALDGQTHIMAVCQPSVPVMAAVSVMEANGDPCSPLSMTLMGGPIDTRVNPTEVNLLAKKNGIEWFRKHVIVQVPWPNTGFRRHVYPGFLQLTGFMTMNLERHLTAHSDLFFHLVQGDGDNAEKHRDFYDEYLAVMDLSAEFYLQTVDTVFVRHALPKGVMMHHDERVDPSKIRRTALMTVEGEKDDISGVGQTQAAHALCSNLPDSMKLHHLQKGVGHYGVFNGSRFKAEIAPKIAAFILAHNCRDTKHAKAKLTPVKRAAKAAASKKPMVKKAAVAHKSPRGKK